MDNYKVKVNNEAESKEVQGLFFELGYVVVNNIDCEKGYVVASKNAESPINFDYWQDVKNIVTIQQLRDLVVLKRNSIDDATHGNTIYSYVKLSNGWYYFDKGESNKWLKSVGGKPSYYKNLKPIEKKEMKEFLVNHDNKWTLQLLDSDTEENNYRVAVPSGATHYSEGKYSGKAVFLKVDGINQYEYYNDVWLSRRHPLNEMYFTTQLLWQRSETESLNDQCVGIERVRQETIKVTIDELKHRVYKKGVSHLGSIDVYRVLELFNVQSHAVGHAIKKLLCSGGRGAKDEAQDIQEAIDSLIRYQEMENEDREEDCVSIDW